MIMTQREHVYGLAAANGITVVEDPTAEWGDSSANWMNNSIRVSRLDYDESYAAALHELGHLIAPGGNLRKGEVNPKSKAESLGYTVHEEATAWTWAKAHALVWNATMDGVMKKAFASYTDSLREAKEEEALAVAAKFLKPSGTPKSGQAAAFFKAGGTYGRPQATRRLPVTDLSKTPLTPEAVAFNDFKKMIEALFGGVL